MLVDVVAIIFGIWLSVRRMDVRVRQAEQYPAIDPGAFEAWKARASLVYNVGSLVCFAEILLDNGWEYLARRLGMPFGVLRAVHALIFFGWVGTMVWVWVAAGRARRMGDQLGIAARPPSPPSQ